MKMYEVCVKCGHVGRNHYIDKIFAVTASSGKEAAAKARKMPRVKHHHDDAIRYVVEISEERYDELRINNREDPFFSCRNIQDQRRLCDIERSEEWTDADLDREWKDNKLKYYHKEKIRNPKKYFINYMYGEALAV